MGREVSAVWDSPTNCESCGTVLLPAEIEGRPAWWEDRARIEHTPARCQLARRGVQRG